MNIFLAVLKYPPDHSGDGLRLHRFFTRLLRKKSLSRVHVLTSWDGEEARHSRQLDEIKIDRVVEYTGKNKYEKSGKWLKKIAVPFGAVKTAVAFFRASRDADIVFTSGAGWFPSLVGWLAWLKRKPLVKEIVLMGADDPMTLKNEKSFFSRWFFLAPFRRAALVSAVSLPLKESCLAFGLDPEKVWSRTNPVDVSAMPMRELENIRSLGSSPMILWVGTVTPRKNVDFLIKAASHLRGPVQVVFIGPCPDSGYRRALDEFISLAPPGVEIFFPGPVSETRKLLEWYAKASLFWFASHREGTPNVVLESLACGTPVVTLPVGGSMAAVICRPQDGEIIETDDPRVFAAVVERWLVKSPDWKDIAEFNRRRFDAEVIDEEYVSWFRRILEKTNR